MDRLTLCAMETFTLDPRLTTDTFDVGALPLCAVRLHRDARYPWVILVPRRPAIREIHQLTARDQAQLAVESAGVAAAMQRALEADSMNVAALGNVVRQLHLHHIARYEHDDAWPAPVWGVHPLLSYFDEERERRLQRLRRAFSELTGFAAAARPSPEG